MNSKVILTQKKRNCNEFDFALKQQIFENDIVIVTSGELRGTIAAVVGTISISSNTNNISKKYLIRLCDDGRTFVVIGDYLKVIRPVNPKKDS